MWIFTWVFAAFLNSVMDLTENENFSSSIFKNLNPKFWSKRESWKYAKKIGGYKLDAWHLSKSAMIIMFAATFILYYYCPWWHVQNIWLDIGKDLLIAGIIWNVRFNFFYKKLGS